MSGIRKRKFGRTGLTVTDMGFGAAPIGNFQRPISEEVANAMVERAWAARIRYFDTAPYYGHGLSEARLGASLRWKPRDEFVVSSKVGRLLKAAPRKSIDFRPWVDGLPFNLHFDYSYDGAMRSLEDSLQRLALERMDVAFIHDCDVFSMERRRLLENVKRGVTESVRAVDEPGDDPRADAAFAKALPLLKTILGIADDAR